MDTTAYIRQQLNSRFQNAKPKMAVAVNVIPEKDRSTFMQKFLGFCIIFLAVATMLALIAKGMGFDIRDLMISNVATPIESRTEVVIERPTIDSDSMTRTQANSWMGSVNARLDKMDEDYKVWRHRIWLLALAQNENATINSRYHSNGGYITFDDMWKINKVPETMGLTPEQKQQMQNDIKQKTQMQTETRNEMQSEIK